MVIEPQTIWQVDMPEPPSTHLEGVGGGEGHTWEGGDALLSILRRSQTSLVRAYLVHITGLNLRKTIYGARRVLSFSVTFLLLQDILVYFNGTSRSIYYAEAVNYIRAVVQRNGILEEDVHGLLSTKGTCRNTCVNRSGAIRISSAIMPVAYSADMCACRIMR